MSQISLKNISKSYFDRTILENIELQINNGDKFAIIGENGAGKTTLLRIILGQEQPDSENAEIQISKKVGIGYLKQQLNPDSKESDSLFNPEIDRLEKRIHALTILLSQPEHKNDRQLLDEYAATTARFESLDGYHYRYRLLNILSGLGIDQAAAKRPVSELSGGERMRVALAKLLLQEPDIMLLDEPTNHLDHRAIEWLEKFLSLTKSTVIAISHDRLFIDHFANKTAELAAGKLTVYPGNYSDFQRIKKGRQKSLQSEIKKTETAFQRQNEITQTMLSHRKIASYHSSQKKADRLKEHLKNLKTQQAKGPTNLKFNILKGIDLGDPNKIILSARDLNVRFKGQTEPLFKPFSFDLKAKEKVMIVGQNGCGKTTLINSLLGREAAAKGTVSLTKDIKYGVLGQLISFSDETESVIDSLQKADPHLTEADARNKLAQFGFRGIDVFKSINSLSGGERSRLYLAHLLSNKPDILFLDEPTNHLDINSCEILEKALLDYEGAVLAVSHDRYFIEKIGQAVFGFINHEIRRFPNYSSFRNAEERAIQKGKPALARESEEPVQSGQEIDVAGAESEQPKPLWRNEELRLQKNLSEIPFLPLNPIQARRFRAISDQISKELEEKIRICEKKKADMEATFQSADDSKIYVKYNQLLILLEKYEDLYLKIYEVNEQLTN